MKLTLSLAQSSLFIALTAFSSLSAHAACDRPVDPSRATIYIGLNQSILENAAAEEAACARGETFIQIPKPLAGVEAATIAMGTKVRLESTIKRIEDEKNEKCSSTTVNAEAGTSVDPNVCSGLDTRMATAKTELAAAESTFNEYWNRLSRSVGGMNMLDLYNETLLELASKNVRIKTLIFSGHSGGNGVWGSLGVGGIQFEPMQNRIKAAFSGKENLLSELNSILLWGCNTINPYSSPASWVKFHPNLMLIFGFQGSAPSAKNPASPMLLRSVMLAEKELPKIVKLASPEAEIQKLFDGLKGISHTIGSAFVNSPGKDKGWYYERTFKRDYSVTPNKDTWVSKVAGTVMCDSIRDELTADQAIAQKYLDGELAIPADTSSGDLRELYTRSRRNEECRKRLNLKITADQVGYLLFWNDVKKNAARLMSPRVEAQMAKVAKLNIPADIKSAIERANKDEANSRAQNLKLMQQKIDEQKAYLKRASDRIEALQEIGSSYQWTERDEKRMKKLEDKARRKKGKKALKFANEFALQYEIKQIAKSYDPADALRRQLQYWNNHRTQTTKEITLIEANMKSAQPPIPNEKSAEISETVTKALNGIPELDVNAVTPLSISELRKKLGAALELITAAKSTIGNSSALWSLSSELNSLESTIKNYNKIALELRTECLDFPTWHEYLVNPVDAPRSSCTW